MHDSKKNPAAAKPPSFLNSTGIWLPLLLPLMFVLIPTSLSAQVPEDYFRQNCLSCHTIGGGRLTGPDLRGLSERQNRDWLLNWLLDPEGVLRSGDPYAVRLQRESRGAVMARSPGMNRPMAEALLDLIEAEAALEKSQFAGTQVSDRPLLPEDIELGRQIFTGRTLLQNGGPACIACHTVNGLGSLGGGRLGPNLTRAYATLEGRKGLAAWLSAPPGATMTPIYQGQPLDSEEVLPLVAYLKDEAERDAPEVSSQLVNFLLAGCAGAAVLLVLFDLLWNHRFRGVRRRLVNDSVQGRSPAGGTK